MGLIKMRILEDDNLIGQLDNLTSKKAIFEKLVKEWDDQKRIKIPKIEKNKQPKYNKNDLKNK